MMRKISIIPLAILFCLNVTFVLSSSMEVIINTEIPEPSVPSSTESPWANWMTLAVILLVILIVGFIVLHLRKKVKKKKTKKKVKKGSKKK